MLNPQFISVPAIANAKVVSFSSHLAGPICDPQLSNDKHRRGSIVSRLVQSREDERKRLSRDLHDGIGQSMSLIASECALLAAHCPDAPPGLRHSIASIRDRLDKVCLELHILSHNLHSYKLQYLGLIAALKDMCSQLSAPELQIIANIESAGNPKSEEVALCLYRVAQEAVSNCIKHSHARKIVVTLAEVGPKFFLTVSDSGIGFDAHVKHYGLGLVSMKERMTLVNGRLNITSIVGRGTTIRASV